MINLLVVSDTHGNYKNLDKVLSNQFKFNEKFRPTHLLHLGDGIEDIIKCKSAERFCVCAVKGNCDSFFYSETHTKERLLELGGCKILMMHGHTHAVKVNDFQAVSYAAELGADLLLYGHTHVPVSYTLEKGTDVNNTVFEKTLSIFNPGSLGYDGNFGVISIDEGKVYCSH